MGTGKRAPISGSTTEEPSDPLTPVLPIVDAILRVVAWRRGLPHDEAEEFGAWAKLRLVEKDIVRKFRGDSSIETYLTVVVNNLFLDFRASITGKFRPSVAARDFGDVGVEFERLIVRQGHSVREACEILRARGHTFLDAELEALALKLPVRRSQLISMDPADLERVAPHAPVPVDDPEKRHSRGELLRHLNDLLRDLPPRDRMVIRVHLIHGFSIAAIARVTHDEEQTLRRRLRRVLTSLREELERRGLDRSLLQKLFP